MKRILEFVVKRTVRSFRRNLNVVAVRSSTRFRAREPGSGVTTDTGGALPPATALGVGATSGHCAADVTDAGATRCVAVAARGCGGGGGDIDERVDESCPSRALPPVEVSVDEKAVAGAIMRSSVSDMLSASEGSSARRSSAPGNR